MKKKIALIVISLSVVGFIFQPQIKKCIKEDVKGCIDPTANNYNELANIDDGSCSYEDSLSPELFRKIDSFKKKDWDKANYSRLRDEILIYFRSVNKTDSREEKNSLYKLDMAHMHVLEKETDKAISNCFNSSNQLKNEVIKFNNKFGNQNTSIKNARNWFISYSEIFSFKKKVDDLLKKEYNKEEFVELEKEITDFSNSKIFLRFNHCNKLKDIISNSINRLEKFQKINGLYNKFLFDYSIRNASDLSFRSFVSPRDLRTFTDYEWYKNKVTETDSILKELYRQKDLEN